MVVVMPNIVVVVEVTEVGPGLTVVVLITVVGPVAVTVVELVVGTVVGPVVRTVVGEIVNDGEEICDATTIGAILTPQPITPKGSNVVTECRQSIAVRGMSKYCPGPLSTTVAQVLNARLPQL